MGLLDKFNQMFDPNDPNYVRTQGLLGLGSGLLQASGASDTPVSMGQALGMGLQGMGTSSAAARNQILAQQKENRLQQYQNMLDALYKPYIPKPGTPTPGATPPISGMPPTEGAPAAPTLPLGTTFKIGPRGPEISVDPLAAARAAQEGIGTTGLSPADRQKLDYQKAQEQQKAAVDLPTVETSAQEILNLTDQLLTHPGKQYSLGAYSMAPTIPGTDQAAFRTLQDQVKGKQFMQAYQTLKGGGQITEVEGKKATEALARMNDAQKVEDYDKAVRDFQSVVKKSLENARKKAGVKTPQGQAAAPQSGVKKITSDAEYNALPSGTVFIAPDGSTRRKP